jgi:hypothetical protein
MLEQLNAAGGSQGRRPLIDVITRYLYNFRPDFAYSSGQIVKSNNDCVLASLRTVKRRTPAEEADFADKVTSLPNVIKELVAAYRMQAVSVDRLRGILPTLKPNERPARNANRVFISTPAEAGSGLHAYAAIGVDAETGKIIAWDPDDKHQDLKLVPLSLIRSAFANS